MPLFATRIAGLAQQLANSSLMPWLCKNTTPSPHPTTPNFQGNTHNLTYTLYGQLQQFGSTKS